jgi:hypothetical protein
MSDEDSRYLKQPRRITQHPTSAFETFLRRGLRTVLKKYSNGNYYLSILTLSFDILVSTCWISSHVPDRSVPHWLHWLDHEGLLLISAWLLFE